MKSNNENQFNSITIPFIKIPETHIQLKKVNWKRIRKSSFNFFEYTDSRKKINNEQ